jgi:ABC-type nitrate/sulfonate/bicarbonate transport system substrate-binding protein
MSDQLTTLRLAGGAQGFNWLPVFVAEQEGIFARNGLAIEFQRLGSVDKATAAVKEGNADLAITPPEGAVANFLDGGPLRIIASNSERLPMSLVARPEITSLEALRGKRLGTSSLTEGTSLYIRPLLASAGLHYPGDYEFVLAGVHTARWDALQANEIDAAPQPAPWNVLAQDAGYNLIGEIPDVLPEIVFAAVVGDAAWLSSHGEVARRFVASLAEAHAVVNDPSHDETTLPVYQRITTPDNPAMAARGLEYTRDLGMWPQGAAVSAPALAATIDIMIQAGLVSEDQRVAAAGVLDPSFTAGLVH